MDAHGADFLHANIVIAPDDQRDLKRLLAGRSMRDVRYFGGDGARRNVVEVILLTQALDFGGWKRRIEFVDEENYRRMLRLVISGKMIGASSSVWDKDIDPARLFKSPPLVNEGDSLVGFYTHPSNHKALAVNSVEALQKLTAVSNQNWTVDWLLLSDLRVGAVFHARNWDLMVDMISLRRADFMLSPFVRSEGLLLKHGDRTLMPIPGISVVLPGSRHWVVSRNHPEGRRFFDALLVGIKLLQKEGRIRRAYIESGFINPSVENWKKLEVPSSPLTR